MLPPGGIDAGVNDLSGDFGLRQWRTPAFLFRHGLYGLILTLTCQTNIEIVFDNKRGFGNFLLFAGNDACDKMKDTKMTKFEMTLNEVGVVMVNNLPVRCVPKKTLWSDCGKSGEWHGCSYQVYETKTGKLIERISYGELAELQSLKDFIKPGDVELLEAAGVPEEHFRQ